jgi:multicomponent Na+:H+ antiporter subunit E
MNRMAPQDAALRAALLAGWWWLLTRGEVASWLVGAPVVIAATWVSGVLVPAVRWRWHPWSLLRFAGFFLGQSAIGGVDVAWRALHPRLPLQPGFVACAVRLPPGAARVCLTNVISLMPGTLAVRFEGATLIVHTVMIHAPVAENVRKVEARIADLFGVTLPPPNPETA